MVHRDQAEQVVVGLGDGLGRPVLVDRPDLELLEVAAVRMGAAGLAGPLVGVDLGLESTCVIASPEWLSQTSMPGQRPACVRTAPCLNPYAPAHRPWFRASFRTRTEKEPASEKPPRLRQAARDRRPDATARDSVQALADDPFPRLLEREDGGQGARYRADRRHPARQPRGRGAGRPQGGRASGARPRRQGHGARRHPAVDTRQQPRVAVGTRGHHHARHRDRPQARRDDDPEGRGPVGHPLRRPAARPAGGARRPGAADPDPRDPRDRAGRGQPRGDRDGQPEDAGDELRTRRSRRLAADEDDASRRRSSRLPGDRGPGRDRIPRRRA